MKKVLITGTSSGIGKAIFDSLDDTYEMHPYTRHDLHDTTDKFDNLDIDILINCAGVAYYGLHETLDADKIKEMVRVNLEAPMILTNKFLSSLKKNKGIIVNISSVTADGINTHGCAYGATKAGLTSFSKSLFAEVRKHGIRVIDIKPDMTKTNLYRNANFNVSDDRDAYLDPKDVANTVKYAIETPGITEIKIQPQKHQISK